MGGRSSHQRSAGAHALTPAESGGRVITEIELIHHMSFGARDTARVADVLAQMLGATALRAPTPPFPYGAWLVCTGDEHGTFLEIVPATTVFDPKAPLGVLQGPEVHRPNAAHVLIGSPLDSQSLQKRASDEGWPVQEVETGLFRIVKVWVEGHLLVEFLSQGEVTRYADAFGTKGMPSLDGKLRTLEQELGAMLSTKLSPQMLTEALGRPVAA
jgi:hypothetical protein